MKSTEWTNGPAIPATISATELPGLAAESESMDARIFQRDEQGQITAWASLWWTNTPELDGAQVAAIGGFGAIDRTSAVSLLDESATRLRSLGYRIVVGPMNGNTWRTYRFVVESEDRGPFLMEPRNPSAYPAWWKTAGFEELAGYSSSLIPLDGRSTVPDSLASRLKSSGVTVRDLDIEQFEAELEAIHDITLAGFSNNFLYTPLSKDAFMASYRKIKDRVVPGLVRIAERGGKPCGYVFAIADLEATARGEAPALIIKTLTVDPAARCAGLGSLLVDEVQRRGHEAGFRHAIHALQYDGNNVLRITARHSGQRFRRYALFSKIL
jgi:ribosomal protein S18 acetylase RimI-like enzyme